MNNPLADTASSDNPYAAIAIRNLFGLNPPTLTDTNVVEDPGLPKITPTGISGVFGSLQVLFKVSPAKPAPADKDQFYVLSEGQRQDDIEVVKIDYQKSLVTFDNHGTTQELPLAEAAGSGGGGTTAPATTGGMPGLPSRGPGVRGNPGPVGFGGAGAATTTWGTSTPGNNNNNPGNSANGGLNFGADVQGRIYQPEASTVPREVSEISLAGNHLKAIQENDPTAPLFPPSALDKEAGIPSNVTPPPEPSDQ
jgi:hypothetical protein